MINVRKVAEMLIYLSCIVEEGGITNLALNKLLYYAQGHHLAQTGEPLFSEAIEAWEYGPVISVVYHVYKKHGRNLIPSGEKPSESDFSCRELTTIIDVLREYGRYSASYLVKMTHSPGTPWSQVYQEGRGQNAIIPVELLEEYFKTHDEITTTADLLARIPIAETKRDESGIWIVPVSERDVYEV